MLSNRYGRLPHELIPDFPSTDPYVVYCFNEAVALAGLSHVGLTARSAPKTDEPTPTHDAGLIEVSRDRVVVPHPQGSGIISSVGGVPFISGRVPIVRKKN